MNYGPVIFGQVWLSLRYVSAPLSLSRPLTSLGEINVGQMV